MSTGYEASLERVALFPDLGRSVVEMSGRSAYRIVNGLVTNAIGGLPEGRGCYAFLLDSKGRPIVDLRVVPRPGFEHDDEEAAWLDVPREGLDGLLEHLGRTVPPIFASFAARDTRVLTLIGPEAVPTAAAAIDAEPDGLEALAPLGALSWGSGGLAVAREQIEGGGLDLYVPAERADDLEGRVAAAVGERGGATADRETWDVLRVERGLPVHGRELTPDRLVQEAGQDERAIDFHKGCFTGQEVVARVHYRGHVNRHLRGVRLDRGADEAPASLFEGERRVGSVHSAVDSPRFGPVALAYVRREVEPGARVASEPGGPAALEVVELPFTFT